MANFPSYILHQLGSLSSDCLKQIQKSSVFRRIFSCIQNKIWIPSQSDPCQLRLQITICYSPFPDSITLAPSQFLQHFKLSPHAPEIFTLGYLQVPRKPFLSLLLPLLLRVSCYILCYHRTHHSWEALMMGLETPCLHSWYPMFLLQLYIHNFVSSHVKSSPLLEINSMD